MRKMITAALVATMLGCGGAPVATPAEDAGLDAGWDAGWPPDSGEVPTDCTPGDGPCCSGSGYFMLAGTVCGATRSATSSCVVYGTTDWTRSGARVFRCSGTSSACDVEDEIGSGVRFRCPLGCSPAAPDCSSVSDACRTDGALKDYLCDGVEWVGEF